MVNSIPMKFSITKANKECLYSPVSFDEYITTSLFILEGEELKARMIIQGPIASGKVSSSAEVLAAGLRYDKSSKDLALNIDTDVDFEDIYEDMEDDEYEDDDYDDDDYYDDDQHDQIGMEDDMDDAMYEEYYYMDDDDEYEFMEDDSMDDKELTEIRKAKSARDGSTEEERKKAKEQRKADKVEKFQKMKARREQERAKRQAQQLSKNKRKAQSRQKEMERKQKAKDKRGKGLDELRAGEPFQKTYVIDKEGWYRFCVEAQTNVIEVEMELRTSSELGRPNHKTGHIQTYEHHDMIQREKKLLKRMTPEKVEENGVKEDDLKNTKNQISKLNRLLYEIKEMQRNERHRLSVHKAVNDHSHSRMVLNSLFETIFYIVVSGFQVYTIRKWFTGSPILGY
jgi:hypothetical protein